MRAGDRPICLTCSTVLKLTGKYVEKGAVSCSNDHNNKGVGLAPNLYDILSSSVANSYKISDEALYISDAIDKKGNTFTIERAGDGNIRMPDPFIISEMFDPVSPPTIIRTVTVRIISGGLRDNIAVCFIPELPHSIQHVRPLEVLPVGSAQFDSRKMNLSWCNNKGFHESKMPLVGTNDKLQFAFVTNGRVNFWPNLLDLGIFE